MTTHPPFASRFAVLLTLLLLFAVPAALAQRTGGGKDDGGKGDDTLSDGGRTEVTAAQENAILHTVLALSILDGQVFRPLSDGGSGTVVCNDCGDWPGSPPDCAGKRQKVHDAAKANADAQKVLDQWQSLLEAYYSWQFWGGVGSMISDMVVAAGSIISAGTATGALLAAAEVVAEMGVDAGVGAMQDAVADAFGVDLSSESAIQDLVSQFNDIRKQTNADYQAALNDWLNCLTDRKEAEAAVEAWNACWATRECWIE